jgi:hypothetical protein
MVARVLNISLGAWLFLSTFLWPHGGAQFWNALAAGALVVAFAFLALRSVPEARYANTAIGIWLVISTFLLRSLTAATVWNHFIVGFAVLVLSVFPNVGEQGRPGTGRTAPAGGSPSM